MTLISHAAFSPPLRFDSARAEAFYEPSSPTNSAAAVVFDRVTKDYQSSVGRVRALESISCSVPKGSIFGVIGRSGAGKSTLLRTINRLESPSSGKVIVEGQDVATLGGRS